MEIELPEPNLHTRVLNIWGEDCLTPQWVLPEETITAYTDGVESGGDFHGDLPALRASALATLAAIEWVEQHAPEDATTEAAERSG